MSNNEVAMVHKNLSVSGVKVLDASEGIVEAFVSGIGNKDSVGDIIQPGAFDRSISSRKPKGVWAHDWTRPVSKTLEIYEVPAGDGRLPDKMKLAGIGGLYVKTQFNLKTEDGRYAFENVLFYDDESEWSIGYAVVDSEYDKKQKAVLLKDIELYEYSPVLFGANPLTSTVSIKVAGADGDTVAEITVSDFSNTDEKGYERLANAIKDALDSTKEDLEVQVTTDETKADDAAPETVEDAEVTPEVEVEDTKVESDDAPEVEDTDEGSEVAEGIADVIDEETSDDVEVDIVPNSTDEKSDEQDEAKTAEEIAELRAKALIGSLEERRQQISEALNDEFGGDSAYIYVYATFDDYVVFEKYDYMDSDNNGFFQVSYEKDGDDYEFGEATEVDIVEVVVAKHFVLDAIGKGHGDTIKTLLAPLAEKAVETAPFFDVDIAKALLGVKEFKAGRALSKATENKIKEAVEILTELIDSPEEDVEAEEKGEDNAPEVKSEESEVEGHVPPVADEDVDEQVEVEETDEGEEKALDIDAEMRLLEELAASLDD